MFDNTLTLTINAVEKVLVRINQDSYSSEYFLREDTGEFSLRIRNTSYNRKDSGVRVERHNVELLETVFGATVDAAPIIRKAYMVFENDRGDTLDSVEDFVVGMVGFLTGPHIVKMLNRES